MNGDYYTILWIGEKEMDEMIESPLAAVATFPHYASVGKNGTVRFWPKIDPTKYVLMAKQGVV